MTLKTTVIRSVTIAALAAAGLAIAGGPPTIDSYTIDGGGGFSSGGNFALAGTVGQPDAGPRLTGGGFELMGGFWAAVGDCPADLNGNGQIDLGDLNIVLANFGVSGTGDVNGDGTTDLSDLNQILANFGQLC